MIVQEFNKKLNLKKEASALMVIDDLESEMFDGDEPI
jgi:hypothetical protein